MQCLFVAVRRRFAAGSRCCRMRWPPASRLLLLLLIILAGAAAVLTYHLVASIAQGVAGTSQATANAAAAAGRTPSGSGSWPPADDRQQMTTKAAAAVRAAQHWFPDFAQRANVRCDRIVNGDRGEAIKAARYVIRNRRFFTCVVNDWRLANVTCEALRAAGYADRPSSAAGATFPLAFGLRMHTCASQAELLLRSVYEPQNVYCLHVDSKAGTETVAAMRRLAACLPNVLLAPLDDDFVYASVSQLRADLTCMRMLLAASPMRNNGNGSSGGRPRWRYFLNLAGQELPLLTNSELVALLRAYNGSNEIKSARRPIYRYRYRFRFWCTDVLTNRTSRCPLPRTVKRPPPGRVPVYKGLAYGFFSRAFVEYATGAGGRASPATALYDWFKDTYAPEEHFFATLARIPGAPGGYDVDDDGRAVAHATYDVAVPAAESAAVGGAGPEDEGQDDGDAGDDERSSEDAEKLESAAAAADAKEELAAAAAVAGASALKRLPTSRAVAWLGGRKRCYGRWVRQVCVYGVGDLPWLAWQPQAIANKFRYDIDPLALQCMAERVLNRTSKQRIAAESSSADSPITPRARQLS